MGDPRRLLPFATLATKPAEAAAFIRSPFAADAVRLRRWDDAAKVPNLPVPPVAHYRGRIDAVRLVPV